MMADLIRLHPRLSVACVILLADDTPEIIRTHRAPDIFSINSHSPKTNATSHLASER